jgi:suppressor for copper-sensitivity B
MLWKDVMHSFLRWTPSMACFLLVGSWIGTASLPAQATKPFSLPSQFQGLAPDGVGGTELDVHGRIELTADRTQGVLRVTATPGRNWHIYSITQADGGPLRTKILLEPSTQFELLDEFRPDEPPQVTRLEFYDVPVEEHHGRVTWTAPLRVAAETSPDQLVVRGKLEGQICEKNGGCIPLETLDTDFVAKVTGTLSAMPKFASALNSDKRRTPAVETRQVAAAVRASPIPVDVRFAPAPLDGFRTGTIHAALQGHIEPSSAAAGQTVELVLTAVPDLGWHIYAYASKDPKAISKPMLIAVAEPAGWQVGDVTASVEPTVKRTELPLEPEQRYHETAVTWRLPIHLPPGTAAGPHTIRGLLGFQSCSDDRCDMPAGAYVSATIDVGSRGEGTIPLQFAAGKYSAVAKFLETGAVPPQDRSAMAPSPSFGSPLGGFDLSKIQIVESRDHSLAYILPIAFLGGFLLNFMPCVLPVIGLKVLSFVQQAGQHRMRVLTLNIWYSLGMLSIFWLLATLASAASLQLSDQSLGWGEQFNYDGFTIPLLSVVFVMGLSFIGVWEIPIPGFMGAGRAGQLAQHEGLAGAFFKGVITTILATPCSGPGLATALTWSATKPPAMVYLVFTAMGLGMAMPYLLLGAFPRLIRFIPKPGAWMETFKQLMGFVLMGTVVYMFTLIDQQYVIPTLALIFALWAACWWIGRTPITAGFMTKARAWFTAGAFATMIGWLAFGYEVDAQHELPWQEFSLAALNEHVLDGRTVMVDFTARWCPTCKVLERSVLNTERIHQLVDRNDVVPMIADWSDGDEEIGETLAALGSKQLPVIAIFPAGDAYRPKRLTGMYTREELARNLQAAGASITPRLAADPR